MSYVPNYKEVEMSNLSSCLELYLAAPSVVMDHGKPNIDPDQEYFEDFTIDDEMSSSSRVKKVGGN